MRYRVYNKPKAVTAAGLLTAAALLLSGCGGDSSSDSGDGGDADKAAAASPDSGDDHAGHEDHDMGDPGNTPAADIADAEVQKSEFSLLDTRPPGMDDVEGTAWKAQHDKGTTVTVSATGLDPNEEYIAHLHEKPCSEDGGGPHFKFDKDGSELPPNEVHLALSSDGEGKVESTVNNDQKTGEKAPSLVVHPKNAQDNKIACVDF